MQGTNMDNKIRIGIGVGGWPFATFHSSEFFGFVNLCEEAGIDSLWFSDRLSGHENTLDPIVSISALCGMTKKMKFGTSALILPLRQPSILAKQLATLDFLSNGRLLVVVGIGQDQQKEFDLAGVVKKHRGRITDESIAVMRTLWSGEKSEFDGEFFSFKDVTVLPKPVQSPSPPIWIGGRSWAALDRVAKMGDGWLPSTTTPEECSSGIQYIKSRMIELRNEIPDDHYGAFIPFHINSDRQKAKNIFGERFVSRRSDITPDNYCAAGTSDDVLEMINKYINVGVSKFVMRPVADPEEWNHQIELLGTKVLPRIQTPFSISELQERAGEILIGNDN